MSAYMCDDSHLAQLAGLLVTPWSPGADPIVPFDTDPEWATTGDVGGYVFRELAMENARSLSARYREAPFPPLPSAEVLREIRAMDPSRVRANVGVARMAACVISAVDCYSYQSCEHEGWETSRARDWTRRLRNVAIDALVRHALVGRERPWGAPFAVSVSV